MFKRTKWAYAFLGGALAWFTHLFFTSAIGESVCTLDGTMFTLLGYPASGWMLLTLSVLCFGAAVGAGVVSFGLYRSDHPRALGIEFLGRAGLAANTLFAFVILAQVVPIFVLLNDC